MSEAPRSQPSTDSGHPFRTLVEMARAAQHDDRQSTGALYGKLADRIEYLEARVAILDFCCSRVDCLVRGEAMDQKEGSSDV